GAGEWGGPGGRCSRADWGGRSIAWAGGPTSGLPRPRSTSGSPWRSAASATRARSDVKYCWGSRSSRAGRGRTRGPGLNPRESLDRAGSRVHHDGLLQRLERIVLPALGLEQIGELRVDLEDVAARAHGKQRGRML